ncbi:hypothetical protein QYM36_016320 [Artemia franciscana]|uniref:Vitamin K-dependent protein C n=1 Tax=Artemia franciscana TaxID=6661 RepID=A0AA88H7G4_ARTSF|nr:hypothetical protein QYM36_016320 [Artemia franciscana]
MLDRSYTHENATVIGWGRLSENGPISPVLRQLTVPIYSDSACKSSKYGTKAITENMMCAGYDNGKLDACQGDCGGPLHYHAADRKIDIIGVVSWGQGFDRAGFPGVYTRVGRYLSWIVENTRDACYCGRREGRTTSDIWTK